MLKLKNNNDLSPEEALIADLGHKIGREVINSLLNKINILDTPYERICLVRHVGLSILHLSYSIARAEELDEKRPITFEDFFENAESIGNTIKAGCDIIDAQYIEVRKENDEDISKKPLIIIV